MASGSSLPYSVDLDFFWAMGRGRRLVPQQTYAPPVTVDRHLQPAVEQPTVKPPGHRKLTPGRYVPRTRPTNDPRYGNYRFRDYLDSLNEYSDDPPSSATTQIAVRRSPQTGDTIWDNFGAEPHLTSTTQQSGQRLVRTIAVVQPTYEFQTKDSGYLHFQH